MNLRQMEKELGMAATEVPTLVFEEYFGERVHGSREYVSRLKKALLDECESKYGKGSCPQIKEAKIRRIRTYGIQRCMFSGFDDFHCALMNRMEGYQPETLKWYLAFVGMCLLWYGFSPQEMSDLKKSDISDTAPLIRKGGNMVIANNIVMRVLRKWKTLSVYEEKENVLVCKESEYLFRSNKTQKMAAISIENHFGLVPDMNEFYVQKSGMYWRYLVSQIGATSFTSKEELERVESNLADYNLWMDTFYPNERIRAKEWTDRITVGQQIVAETMNVRLKYRKELVTSVTDEMVTTDSHVYSKRSRCALNDPYTKMLDADSLVVQSLLVEYSNSFIENYGVSALVLSKLYRKMLADGSGDNRTLDALELAITVLNEQADKQFKEKAVPEEK